MAANYNMVQLSTQHFRDQQAAYARDSEQRARTWQQLGERFSNSIQRGVDRRQQLADRNRTLRDAEYAEANRATDKLFQTESNHKYTDQQLQQVGQQFKQEFYDAVKEYEASDKGDEARQKFEQIKQTSLGSARTLGDSIEKLDASMDAFMEQARNGGISDSVNPAVRAFMLDLNNPKVPADQYKIEKDENGDLKYVGTTTPTEENPKGHEVSFFLKDIANGENGFTPSAKEDMPKLVSGLMKGVVDATKREKTDWGYAEVTDWGAIELQLEGRIEDLFSNDQRFRQVASGLGYGYEEFEAVKSGEGFTDPDGREIKSIDDLRAAAQEELMQQVEALTPHKSKEFQLRQSEAEFNEKEAIKEQTGQMAVQTNQNLTTTKDFNAYLGRDITLKGSSGKIASIVRKGDNIIVTNRKGDKGSKETYNVNDINAMALLQSQLTGGDYNLIQNSIINSLKVQ